MLVGIVPCFQICISLNVTVIVVSCLMKLRIANKCVGISPTPEIYIIFTALVLPLSTNIADDIYIYIYIYIYIFL